MAAVDGRVGVDGRHLFSRISVDLRHAVHGVGQVYYGPVVLITDAPSYSATDIFAAGFQDNDVGPVVGTAGNTGAGGANFWSLDTCAAHRPVCVPSMLRKVRCPRRR
jgi:hypothetical protein